MRILILSNNDRGLYLFRKELIEKLLENNEVICSIPDSDGFFEKIENLGCKCIKTDFERRGKNPLKDLGLLKRYRTYIRSYNPDAVLTYTIKPNVYGGIACRIEHTPCLANVTGLGTAIENGGILSIVSLALYKIGLKKAECIFFQNENNKRLFENKGITGKNTVLIPGSGVNTQTHFLEPYPMENDKFRFLFVGRVMKDKGINELLEAVELLAKKKGNIHLDIVGGCDEAFQDKLTDYESKGFVKYHGSQESIHPFYRDTHCVVLPSYHEGMANVLLEASSVGRPVIASNIPGCRETFEEDVTGIGCEPRDSESLYRAMEKMVNLAWERRQKMGIAGHDKVAREFDRKIIIDSYIDQLSKICK